MDKHLLEIKYIEDYLLGKLDDQEKTAFEKRLKTDANFAQKVKKQALLMKRIEQIGLKKSISKAHNNYLRKQRFAFRNIVKNPQNAFLTLLGILLIAYLVWEAELQNQNKSPNKIEEVEQFAPVDELQKNNNDTLNLNDSISSKIDGKTKEQNYPEDENQ